MLVVNTLNSVGPANSTVIVTVVENIGAESNTYTLTPNYTNIFVLRGVVNSNNKQYVANAIIYRTELDELFAFNGDGEKTNFDLDPNFNYTISNVYVNNNVKRSLTEYVIADNVLSFNVAPSSGALIEVEVFTDIPWLSLEPEANIAIQYVST